MYKVKNYAELRDSETYALACAYYIYLHDLHDLQPADDLMEYIRKCCPIVYKQVGKIVSSYGGIRCTPSQALDFPLWRKAKQLTWDRAYDALGNLCFVAYYDAGNAAYAGFMKTLLSPEERVQLFRGSENPLEELLGDVFELALGMLTFALRWRGVDTINACINGLERFFSRYSPERALCSSHQDIPGQPTRQQITDVFEHVRKAIVEHPDVITFQEAESEPASRPHRGERASGSNDQMDVESVASQPEGQRRKHVRDTTTFNRRVASSSFGMKMARTYLKQYIAAEETGTSHVARTSLRWALKAMTNSSVSFRRAPVCGITRFLNEVILAYTRALKEEATKIQHTNISRQVSTAVFLRRFQHVGYSSVILHGTTSLLPSHQESMNGEQEKLQNPRSDSFRRT